MTKTFTEIGKTPVTNFHAEVKSFTQPKVLDQYMNDEGETMLILDNGRETLLTRYEAMWNVPKGKIITDKKYKGENCDKRYLYLNK